MKCGLGIRPELFKQVLEQQPELGFLEAHSENYFGESIARAQLLALREHYPVSLHGVGLSLGRADDLNQSHLAQLKALVDQVDPLIVSEHLAWSAYSHRHIPDLLPLPLSEQALGLMCQHIDQMQQALGRQVLVENPSNYLVFDQLQIPEPEFLNELAERTGCGLLVDVNNIYVSAFNIGRDPNDYIDALNTSAIGQYHLAGYTEVQHKIGDELETVLIDTHNQPVYTPVWALFEQAIKRHGARPTLFEWDSDFPELDVLLNECQKADSRIGELSNSAEGSTDQANDQAIGKIELKSYAIKSRLSKPEPVQPEPVKSEQPELAAMQNRFLDDVFSLASEHSPVVQPQAHRISVYQNNLFGAMQDYLAEVYPATQGVVGQDFFKQMVQLLVQLSPPSEGNVHNYGGEMAAVIAHFDGLDALPYLSDLIGYEWALHHAYYGTVSDVIDLSTTSQEQLLTLDVELNSTVSVIKSPYPIYEIHRQSLPSYTDEVSISLDQSSDTLLVYKLGYEVHTQILADALYLLLSEVQKANNLLQAIDALSGSIESQDLSACLGFVFENQLLKSVSTALADEQTETPILH